MAKIEIRVPTPGESIKEVEIETLIHQDGEYVQMDDEVLEIASGKANLAVSAPASGKIEYMQGLHEGMVVAVDSIIGFILVEDNAAQSFDQQDGLEKEVVQKPNGTHLYTPRPWQTDPDIERLVQSCYANILGENPSEEAKKAIIVGIFAYKKDDIRHDCNHRELLEELHKDPHLVVGLFSFCVPKRSAEYNRPSGHFQEFFETYLNASPYLAEILRFPNVVPFSIFFGGDLDNCLAFKQHFSYHFVHEGGKLTRK